MDTSTAVLILKSGHHGGLAITRSLGRWGVPVFLADPDPHASAAASKYCRGCFAWDCMQAPVETAMAKLIAIGRRIGGRIMLIPAADSEALFVAANAAALRERFLFPGLTSPVAESLCSKKEMHALARSLGVATPKTCFPRSRREAMEFADETPFPIILKAIDGRRIEKGASNQKVIVRNRVELFESYDTLENPHTPNLMLQEFIPGGDDASWMFNGYFDEHSNCLFGATGRKIRQYAAYAGVTSLGVCEDNIVVSSTVKRFMRAIRYRGILDIGLRYDARDHLYKVFDVNPRVGCTFRLFVTEDGMDVVRTQYLHLTGQAISAGRVLNGRKWMAEDIDLASSVRYWRDGKLNLREWISSFRGLKESAFLAWDDPQPVVDMCVSDLGRMIRRGIKNAVGARPKSKQPRKSPQPLERSAT